MVLLTTSESQTGRLAGCTAKCLRHSHGEKPEEVVKLRKICHTWAFQGTEGSWPLAIQFATVVFHGVVFFSHEKRENVEN